MATDGESKEDELWEKMNEMNEMNSEREKAKEWERRNARYIEALKNAQTWGETRDPGYPPTPLQILEIEFSSTLNSLQKGFLNKFRKGALPALEPFFETLDSRQENIFYEWRKVYCGDVDKCQDNFDSFFNRIRQRVPMRVGFDVPVRDDVAYNRGVSEMAKFMQSVKEHQLRLQHIAETKIFLGDEEISYVELDLTGMGIEELKLLEAEGWKRRREIEAEEDHLDERIQERRKEELEKILGKNTQLDEETLVDYIGRAPHVLSLPDWKKDLVYRSYDHGRKDNLKNEMEYHLPRNGLYPGEKRMITKFFGRQGKGNKHKVRRTRHKKSTRSKRRPKKSGKRPKKSVKRPKKSVKRPKKSGKRYKKSGKRYKRRR